jgi:hypothetical protein
LRRTADYQAWVEAFARNHRLPIEWAEKGVLGVLMRSQRLDLTDNERAVLITALRRLVDFNPQPLSPQIQALKAILERLEPQKPQPIPDTASTG